MANEDVILSGSLESPDGTFTLKKDIVVRFEKMGEQMVAFNGDVSCLGVGVGEDADTALANFELDFFRRWEEHIDGRLKDSTHPGVVVSRVELQATADFAPTR